MESGSKITKPTEKKEIKETIKSLSSDSKKPLQIKGPEIDDNSLSSRMKRVREEAIKATTWSSTDQQDIKEESLPKKAKQESSLITYHINEQIQSPDKQLIQEGNQLKEKGETDKLLETDIPKEISPSYNPESGWIGSSCQTSNLLLQRALTQLDIKSYSEIETLTDDIYRLYRIGNKHDRDSFMQKVGKNPKSIQDTIWYLQQRFNEDSFESINRPEGVEGIITPGYVSFTNKDMEDISKEESGNNIMRMSININPHRFIDVTNKIIENISTLDYVMNIKVTSNLKIADEYYDNMIIYFKKGKYSFGELQGSESQTLSDLSRSENLVDLTNRVSDLLEGEDTRHGHAAFLQPIAPEKQGIAYGENFYDTVLSQSWGEYRARAIAEALLDLNTSGQDITFETALPKVEEQLNNRGINHKRPHLFIQEWSPVQQEKINPD